MIRILNAEPAGYCDEARTILRRLGELVEAPLDRDELVRRLPEFDVLIVRLGQQIDGPVLAAGARLKAIVTATTGLDHVDTELAGRQGIAVLSLRGESEFLQSIRATAEHTWALLLALLRRIPQAAAAVAGGTWDRDRFRGRELAGKRLGLVGLGRIGRQVARYGSAFDMAVSAHDPFVADWPAEVGRVDSLEQLLPQSDVLSVHVPLRESTRGLIGRPELARLPRGAVLVNTSRGEVIDEAALVEALAAGGLAVAAVDVIPGERDCGRRAGSALIDYARRADNLLITPHIGGATSESMARTEVFMAQKLARFLQET